MGHRTRGFLIEAGAEYAFNRAPKHSKSKYLVVNAGHANTPDVAKAELVAWLKSLCELSATRGSLGAVGR